MQFIENAEGDKNDDQTDSDSDDAISVTSKNKKNNNASLLKKKNTEKLQMSPTLKLPANDS